MPRKEGKMQKQSTFLFASLLTISVILLANECGAQTTGAPSKAGTRLITLGTQGGPPPRPHRAQSSNLLIVNGSLYVVDAGDGVTRRLAKAGIDIREIGIIFITHHHVDHTGGLGRLMSGAW